MSTDVVESWGRRARAYAALTEAWPIFGRLADRLIDVLPRSFAQRTLDLAGGAGLVSARLAARRPAARVYLMDPAPAMCALARERCAGLLVDVFQAAAEDWGALGGSPEAAPTFEAVLSSAALHLCDEQRVFSEVARHLAPGGVFAFTLWGHSFEETRDIEPTPPWQAAVARALARRDPAAARALEPPGPPAVDARRVRTRQGLTAAARQAGLSEPEFQVYRDSVPGAFFVDFAAMSPDFLPGVGVELRAEVVAQARQDPELAEECAMPSVRVVCA